MVVHGADGLDEISITGPTRIVEIDSTDTIKDETLDLSDLGIKRYPLEGIKGGSPKDNAQTAMELVQGKGTDAICEAVAINAGAALYVSGIADSIQNGCGAAKEAIASGRVAAKLDEIAKRSTQLKEGINDPHGGRR